MAAIIFGIVVLALGLLALNAFSKLKPHTAAVVLKTGGGLGAWRWPACSACAGGSTSPFRSA